MAESRKTIRRRRWPRRAANLQHVHILLKWLYGNTRPAAEPLNRLIPAKADRNLEIYQRHLAGESPSLLAKEYGVSEQRIYVIVRQL